MAKFYPDHSRYKKSQNYLWISLIPKKLSYNLPRRDKGARQVSISTEKDGETLFFLAPQELMDNIVHNWGPMENILSRLQEKFSSLGRELSLSTQQHKVDTALIYQDSERRQIELTIYLAAYQNPLTEIFEPINQLRKYSSPKLGEVGELKTTVGNPHVFKLDTVTGTGKVMPLINIKNAALTGLQPNYYGPYIYGHPSYAEITLTFNDMEPLSEETFTDIQSRVTVGEGPVYP